MEGRKTFNDSVDVPFFSLFAFDTNSIEAVTRDPDAHRRGSIKRTTHTLENAFTG